MILTSLIVFCVVVAGLLSFVKGKRNFKGIIFIILSVLAFWATDCKEKFLKTESNELREQDKTESNALRVKDKKEADSLRKASDSIWFNRFVEYQEKIRPNFQREIKSPINSIKFENTTEGLLVSYFVINRIEKLNLVYYSQPFDSTFSISFGDQNAISLPTKIGSNEFIVKYREGLTEISRLQIVGDNPFIVTPIVELNKQGFAEIADKNVISNNIKSDK